MIILVCPGFNQAELNHSFINAFPNQDEHWLLYPSHQLPPYSPQDILDFCSKSLPKSNMTLEVILIGFSAGVVGIQSVATRLDKNQVKVKALIAIDGWGVPLWGDFPTYRISHDYFTHWSSTILGAGNESFYADPPVDHLQLWRSPQTTKGWKVNNNGSKIATTALKFIEEILESYRDNY
ncbi:MAG: hypothetical protein EA365_16930 [Gloeocapsa sp. DLM2.Bin57]|nr:MAG: hypothetical protein EA365_16930 [Gloeocapsa sp. DLM2.Bin57]